MEDKKIDFKPPTADEVSKSFNMARGYENAGIRFVCVPVFNDGDHNKIWEQAIERFESICNLGIEAGIKTKKYDQNKRQKITIRGNNGY